MQKFRAGDGLHTPMRHSTEDIYFKIDFTFPFGVWTFQVCRGVRRFSIHWFIPFQLKSKVKAREHFTDGPSIAVYCFVFPREFTDIGKRPVTYRISAGEGNSYPSSTWKELSGQRSPTPDKPSKVMSNCFIGIEGKNLKG